MYLLTICVACSSVYILFRTFNLSPQWEASGGAFQDSDYNDEDEDDDEDEEQEETEDEEEEGDVIEEEFVTGKYACFIL